MQVKDKVVYLSQFNKSLKQAIADGDLSGGGGGGATEIFNTMVVNSTGASTITGVIYFKAPSALTINTIVLQIFEKGSATSGSLTIDIKKNTVPDSVGMTSVFSVLPTLNFAVVNNYATDNGTLNPANSGLSAGDWLRLDVTSIPSSLGKFHIIAYAI
jgi:hypothetical protein